MKYCTHCGKENREEARFCGHCGRAFSIDPPKQTAPAAGHSGQAPNPRTATLLSCLWPGLGQIYNGQVIKGAVFIVVHFYLFLSTFFRTLALTLLAFDEAMDNALRDEGIAVQPLLKPPSIEHLAFHWFLFISLLTAFWIYSMVDARRCREQGVNRLKEGLSALRK
jgi:TM2 domain-containing membrane protein YozV